MVWPNRLATPIQMYLQPDWIAQSCLFEQDAMSTGYVLSSTGYWTMSTGWCNLTGYDVFYGKTFDLFGLPYSLSKLWDSELLVQWTMDLVLKTLNYWPNLFVCRHEAIVYIVLYFTFHAFSVSGSFPNKDKPHCHNAGVNAPNTSLRCWSVPFQVYHTKFKCMWQTWSGYNPDTKSIEMTKCKWPLYVGYIHYIKHHLIQVVTAARTQKIAWAK